MARKLRNVDRYFPPICPVKDRPNYYMKILEHIPPHGTRFSSAMIEVPLLSRRQINDTIHSLLRSGYIVKHRMGMYERSLDTPDGSV